MGQVRYLRTAGLGLLAACALGAMGASAAQAETLEWGKCAAVPGGTGGKYSDAGCTERAEHKGGGYEWARLEGEIELKHMVPIGDVSFETADGDSIQCSKVGTESSTFPLNKKTLTTPLWLFKDCEETEEEETCTSNNGFSGEINNKYEFYNKTWTGKLGFVSGAGTSSPVVGVEYKMLNHERLFEPVKCEGALGTVWIGGSHHGGNAFISTIEPVNKMTNQFTQVYGESAPGVSSVTSFEGKNPVRLEAFLGQHWEPVAMTAAFHDQVQLGEAELEIKATR
jgi:hypothetical protein